jgi:hypothetical protein
MKQTFAFITTLTLLLTLGFKAEAAGWYIVSSPNADAYDNVLLAQYATSSSDIWAVGWYHAQDPGLEAQPLFNHWNGTAWSNVSTSAFGVDSFLYGIGGIASNDVWAAGDIRTTVGGPDASLVVHWNGTSWAQVSLPPTSNQEYLRAIAEINSHDIWAVGAYQDTSVHPLAIHWDGNQWQRVNPPDPGGINSWLSTVTAIASNDVWAFGSDSNLLRGLAYHWNGTQWTQFSMPPPPIGGQSYSISGAYAAASNQIWAVGSYQHNGTRWYTMILYWNGLSWSQVTSPNQCTGDTVSSFLYAVAGFSKSDVWAVGNYDCSGTSQTLTMHFDGDSWKIVSSPNTGSSDNVLYSVSTSRGSQVGLQWMNAVGAYFDTTITEDRTLALQGHNP